MAKTNHFSAKQRNQEGVSVNAEMAIDELLVGASISEAARKVGVSRMTLSKWLNENPVFQAELNKRREEARRMRMAGLASLVSDVEAAVRVALTDPETPRGVILQAGFAFLSKVYGILEAQPVGSTNARKIAEAMKPYRSMILDDDDMFSANSQEVENLLSQSMEELQSE